MARQPFADAAEALAPPRASTKIRRQDIMDTGTKNRLAGAWQRMTGRTQMAAGAQFDDPEMFFNGVVDAMHGQLQEKIGAEQAERFRDALRLHWQGTTQQMKGTILKQWGEWSDDPAAMAQGVADLAQGKLKRYAGATAMHGSSGLSGTAASINDQTADAARQALSDFFASNADQAATAS
jgi:uncharacterized protein YjbJ (UPF0337 family)